MWNETHRSQDPTQGFGLLRFTHVHSREFVGMFQHNEWGALLETQPETRGFQYRMWSHHAKSTNKTITNIASIFLKAARWVVCHYDSPSLMTPRDSEDRARPKCETALTVKMYVQYCSKYNIYIYIYCIYIYISISTTLHIYIYIYEYEYEYVNMNMNVWIQIWIWIYECMNTNMNMNIWIWIYEYMNIWIYECMNVWMYDVWI